jgi:hypothetical protein
LAETAQTLMFSRRWIINYVLVVLIVIFTYVGNRFAVSTGYQSQQRISKLKPADIDTLEIQTADALLTLRRDADGWLLESPIHWPANNINIKRLLSIVNSDAGSRLSADEINLATLGLQFPKAVLRINDTELLFGAANNIGRRRYIMLDSTVFLLPDIHLPFFAQGLLSIVDRRLLPRRYELSRLKLPGLEISRNSNDNWQVANAENGFEQDQITRLVANWQDLEAAKINLFDTSAIPRQKLEIALQDGSKFEFFLMSIDPEIVIAHPQIGLQYHFRADLYYELIALRPHETPS